MTGPYALSRELYRLGRPMRVSDGDEALCRAFDVIHEKNMYGRKVLGVVRSTFLVSPDARIAREWRGVKVPGHAQAVLEALQAEAAQ